MKMTIQHSKYFKAFDESDNECSWRIELVGKDVEEFLTSKQIAFDTMYEDWGLGIGWKQDGVEYSIMVTCVDVERAMYEILFEAFRKRLLILNKLVDIAETRYAYLTKEFAKLDESN